MLVPLPKLLLLLVSHVDAQRSRSKIRHGQKEWLGVSSHFKVDLQPLISTPHRMRLLRPQNAVCCVIVAYQSNRVAAHGLCRQPIAQNLHSERGSASLGFWPRHQSCKTFRSLTTLFLRPNTAYHAVLCIQDVEPYRRQTGT